MAQSIDDLVASVALMDVAVDSAIALLNGISQRIADAIAAALAGGATAAELAPLVKLNDDVKAKTTALSDAIFANTPTVSMKSKK